MIGYIFIFLGSVFISSVSQVLLKKSANREYDSKLKEYLNVQVIVAYTVFFLSSLLTVFSYKGVPLSMGGILESSGYIFVSVLGYIFLHERFSKRKIAGLVIILLGILIFNIESFI